MSNKIWVNREDVRSGDVVLNCRKEAGSAPYFIELPPPPVVVVSVSGDRKYMYDKEKRAHYGNEMYTQFLVERPEGSLVTESAAEIMARLGGKLPTAVNPYVATSVSTGSGYVVYKKSPMPPVLNVTGYTSTPITVTAGELLASKTADGLKAEECLSRYIDNMRETPRSDALVAHGVKHWALTKNQKELAQSMWAAQLKVKASEQAALDKSKAVTVIVDNSGEFDE